VDDLDLARRALAAGMRWMPGMTMIPVGFERERWLICWVGTAYVSRDEDSATYQECGAYQSSGVKWWGIANNDDRIDLRDGWVPDLADPATLGCLEAQVRERWGEDAYLKPIFGGGWVVDSRAIAISGQDHPNGLTRVEALIAALEAPRG
jgi:hypothetical protein